MLPNEQFDAATHSYYRDGIWVPSVTQVLSFYSITKEGPEGPREHARIRGEIVHRMIEDSENGEKMEDVPEIPDGFTADEIWGRYSAWVRFRGDVRISELILEHGRIGEIDGYSYGVTPDVICQMDGTYCAIELKNTYAPEPTHSIQTAAQVMAALRPTAIPALWDRWKRFALYLKGDGSYRLKPHTDQRDFYVWRNLLAGHEEARRLRGEKVWSVQNAGTGLSKSSEKNQVSYEEAIDIAYAVGRSEEFVRNLAEKTGRPYREFEFAGRVLQHLHRAALRG